MSSLRREHLKALAQMYSRKIARRNSSKKQVDIHVRGTTDQAFWQERYNEYNDECLTIWDVTIGLGYTQDELLSAVKGLEVELA